MPAPQSAEMKQFAKLKFSSFAIKVPSDWQQPQGDTPGKQFLQSYTSQKGQPDSPKHATQPDTAVPPLFLPASTYKAHTDQQKMLNDKFGKYIDGICDAICSAWSIWQTSATITAIVIAAGAVSVGKMMGTPFMAGIMASGPKSNPTELLTTKTIATVITTAWTAWQTSLTIPAFPQPTYMMCAAAPAGVLIPGTPGGAPIPLATMVGAEATLQTDALKGQMIGQYGNPTAPYMKELFESVSDAFNKCFMKWKVMTKVSMVQAIAGMVPTMVPIPPAYPGMPGPVATGTAMMPPGMLQ